MKVLFLDNDGVICLSNNWGGRHKKRERFIKENPNITKIPINFTFDDFDKKSIDVLNSIIEETDCEIIVSSDWKLHANLKELSEYYLSQGISKAPIGCTPNMEVFDPKMDDLYMFRGNLSEKREIEIKRFLDNNKIDKWVAVDDLYMKLDNFVYCPIQNEGIKQCGRKEKIIEYLK